MVSEAELCYLSAAQSHAAPAARSRHAALKPGSSPAQVRDPGHRRAGGSGLSAPEPGTKSCIETSVLRSRDLT